MYDKVKARSNRACKAQPHQPQVVDEVKKKEDKIKDQFRALKQSRYFILLLLTKDKLVLNC